MNNAIQQLATLPQKYEDTGNALDKSVVNIINAVIGVLGLVCVVVMIIGGVQYMTSSGDASKVEKGKKTILYGLIGLIVCVLSFAIVNFAIDHFMGSGGSTTSQSSSSQTNSDNCSGLSGTALEECKKGTK